MSSGLASREPDFQICNSFLSQVDSNTRLWLLALNHTLPPITSRLWSQGAVIKCTFWTFHDTLRGRAAAGQASGFAIGCA